MYVVNMICLIYSKIHKPTKPTRSYEITVVLLDKFFKRCMKRKFEYVYIKLSNNIL